MKIEVTKILCSPCHVSGNKGSSNFEVYFEKRKVLECQQFLEGLSAAFGLHFILNLEYPKGVSTILEMVQRYFLKIHPDSGSKSKKISSSKRKVISLIKKIN